jgi:hypothetical protein
MTPFKVEMQFTLTMTTAQNDSVVLACYEGKHLLEMMALDYHGMKEVSDFSLTYSLGVFTHSFGHWHMVVKVSVRILSHSISADEPRFFFSLWHSKLQSSVRVCEP